MKIGENYSIESNDFVSHRGYNFFAVRLVKQIKDDSGQEYLLFKVNIPFRVVKSGLDVHWIVVQYVNSGQYNNIFYFPNKNNFIRQFSKGELAKDKMVYLFTGDIKEFKIERKEIEVNKKYIVRISEPFGFTTPEFNSDGFIVESIDKVKDNKGIKHFLFKVKSPFCLQELSVGYISANYRHEAINPDVFNIDYIHEKLIKKYKEFDLIKKELIFIIIGTIREP